MCPAVKISVEFRKRKVSPLRSAESCILSKQELSWMRESNSFQANLFLFKKELVEDVKASFSADYVKKFLGRKRPLEALSAQIMIKDKLILGLTGGGKSVNILRTEPDQSVQ